MTHYNFMRRNVLALQDYSTHYGGGTDRLPNDTTFGLTVQKHLCLDLHRTWTTLK